MFPTINIDQEIKKISKPWSPIEVAKVNDQVVRLAMFKGTYPFHKHENEDELFFCYRGKITVQLEDSKIVLNQGDMVVFRKTKNTVLIFNINFGEIELFGISHSLYFAYLNQLKV